MRQIGPLHIRTLGELRKLPVIDMHRRRNNHGEPRLLLARLDSRTRVVGGQRVGAAEVEGFPTAAGGAVEVYFLRGYGTVGSDHACCHAAFGVPEKVALLGHSSVSYLEWIHCKGWFVGKRTYADDVDEA